MEILTFPSNSLSKRRRQLLYDMEGPLFLYLNGNHAFWSLFLLQSSGCFQIWFYSIYVRCPLNPYLSVPSLFHSPSPLLSHMFLPLILSLSSTILPPLARYTPHLVFPLCPSSRLTLYSHPRLTLYSHHRLTLYSHPCCPVSMCHPHAISPARHATHTDSLIPSQDGAVCHILGSRRGDECSKAIQVRGSGDGGNSSVDLVSETI